MATSEFELIDRYFAGATERGADVAVGIGDDAALVVPPPGAEIVSVCVALHEGIDFPRGTAPGTLGRRMIEDGLRALAEAAADGPAPRPAWALLGLTLPAPEESWTRDFARGLAHACRSAGLELIGGDTTRGPLTLVCMLHGLRPREG